MSQLMMKLRENEKVCKYCDIAEGIFLAVFPLLLPILIVVATANQW
jgi:hypothetical protein